MVEIPADTVAGMIRERTFSMEIVQICLSSKLARTRISLCLRKDEESLSISGFPRHLMTEEQNVGKWFRIRERPDIKTDLLSSTC